MLIRISLIIAIIAGLAVAAINFTKVKEIITTTRQERDDFHAKFDSESDGHRKTKKELAGTKEKLTATEASLKTAEETRDAAVAEADTSRKRADSLNDKLKTTTQERDGAQAEVAAWRATGIEVNQVKGMVLDLKASKEAIAAQRDELRIIGNKNVALQSKLDSILTPDYRVKLPDGLKGTIAAVDPKWEFVVLNIGANDGVLENGELLVNRNGKLVAKVKVTVVQGDRCIANLVPGWKLGDIIEGDFAIPSF